jgi:hypothetical protein
LMAQYASNHTASWAAAIMASVGLASGFKPNLDSVFEERICFQWDRAPA